MLALPGVVAAVLVVADHLHVLQLRRQIAGNDPKARDKALEYVINEREGRPADEVLALLETTMDRDLLDRAGLAVARIGERRGLDLLRKRADEPPDDPVRARLIGYAARMSERDVRLLEWLTAGARSDEPWRQVGSAAGLLQIGEPEGGRMLIELSRDADPAIRAFAWPTLRRFARPMAQTIGRKVEMLDAEAPPADPQAWDAIAGFWQADATPRLLNDVIRRLEVRDPDWIEMGRLIVARNRVARWLQ